jgi:hypothetical protein
MAAKASPSVIAMIPVRNTYCGKVHFKPSLYVLAQMRINSEVTLIQKYTVPQDLAVESRKMSCVLA